jgi:hypothetical protein
LELHPEATMNIRRFDRNPIIVPEMDARMGANINGPSLIRAPDWLPDPLGRYYLYFAHHHGTYIRLAVADRLEGPWRTYEPGVLHVADSFFKHHVASPDVHVDPDRRELRMYYHGISGPGLQETRVALSTDGLRFSPREERLGRSYFRVFRHGGWQYAISKTDPDSTLQRSRDGLSGFEVGPHILDRARHVAVLKRGDTLHVFLSQIGDTPEHLLHCTMDLSGDWMAWWNTEPESVLRPEHDWEGVDEPVRTSRGGWAPDPVHELRDPGIYEEDGRVYLLYSVAGERGIAIAEIEDWE